MIPGDLLNRLNRLLTRRWTPHIILLALTGLLWGHTVGYEFVWDDIDLIQRAESIRSFSNLPAMFTSLEAQSAWAQGFKLFRPIRLVACAILYQLGGQAEPQAWLFHLANVLCHGIAAILLFNVASQLLAKWFPEAGATRIRALALWTAVAYAGHPVVSEVVCWTKALDDELATLFTLASALCLFRWTNDRQPVTGALVFFLLAIYSKESAVPFAFMAVLIARHYHGLAWPTTIRRTAGFFVATAAFVVHRHLVIGQSSQIAPISGTYAQTLIDMFPVVTEYLKLLWGISPFYIDYTFQKGGHAILSFPVLAGVVLLATAVAAGLWAWRRPDWRFAAFGLCWLGFFLLPVSNLLPMMQYMAERFLYLPLVGWLLLLAGVMIRLQRPSINALACVVLAGFWLFTARDRSFLWRDNLTLFVRSSQQPIHSERVEENAIGAIFAQPQVASVFRFANRSRDLTIVKIPNPTERAPLRQTLEIAHQMFPTNATTARALAILEDWDGRTGRAQALREVVAKTRPAPKLAGEVDP